MSTGIDAEITYLNQTDGEYSEGETVYATAGVENTGDTEHTFFVGYSVHGPDGEVYDNNDETGETVTLEAGHQSPVYLNWDVESNAPDGEYDAQVAVWEESDRDNLSTRLDEEWEYGAFDVQNQESIDAQVNWISTDTGTYTEGESVLTSANVENTGDTDHTYFVGYTVHGPDGEVYDNNDETGQIITISSQESQTIELDWTVESVAPEGEYDAQVAVWKESDRDNLSTRLDEEWEYSAFDVQNQESIDAQINWISTDTGTYTEGESVSTSANVENIGDTDHTYFVGYTVHGPDGEVYDNDDETGKTLTLSPQESQTINLDWTVESNAPEGEYDAQVAVWEESDRNNLSAQLDEEWEYGSFGVEDSEPVDGNIFGINPATGTYTEDDTVTTTVGVKNTGDTSNVFYIGYSVHGPDGGVYDNEETTGETVSLAEGDEQVLDVEWDVEAAAPDGVYDIQVSVWKEPDPDDLQTRLDDQWEHGTFEIEQDDDITGQITAISPAHGQYDGDDSVMTSATIKNTGTVEHSFFVQYTVYGPEASEFHNSHDAGQEVHVQPNESQTIELTWDVEPDAPDGDYDVEIALWEETNPENLENHIDEERESNAFEIVRSDTDYSVAVRDFEDNPVSDAVVRLSSPNNNRTLEEQVNTTQVTFEDLTENEYHYEIESVERNQSDSGVLYTDNPIKQYTAHFPPIGHPHGVVLDDENGFVVPYAEIEIPELGVQTRSDKAGYFDISEKIPKGKYDIRVAVPDGGTIETSAQFGPEYAITLEADSERVSREDSVDGDSYLGDIVESDVLTNLLLETEAIRERIRNGGRAVATAIHGAIRGVAAALYDIFDSIWEVLNVIYENIGIPDFGSLISDLFDIVTNLPTAIAAIGQSLIAGIENFVENASNRQHDVNPHSDYLENTTNPSTSDPEYTWYRTFAGGWGFGYFGFKLLELLAGIGVIRRAGKSIITSGPQAVRDALDTIESTATSLASGTSRGMVSPVGRSGRTMSRSNSGSTSTFDNVLASGLGVARVASANIIKKVRTGIGEIRHKPNEAIGDEIEDTIKNIGEPSQGLGDVQRMKGKLNEWASIGHWVNNENAFRALPSIRSGHVVGKFDISDYNHGDWVLVPKVDRGSSGELDGVLVQVIKNDGEATVTNMKIIEFKKGTDTTDGDRIDPLQERTNKFNTVEKIQNLPGDREIAGTGLRARHFDEVEKKNVYLIGNRKHTGFIRDNPERTPTAADRKWDGYADYASTEIDEYYDALAGLDSQQRRIEFSAPE